METIFYQAMDSIQTMIDSGNYNLPSKTDYEIATIVQQQVKDYEAKRLPKVPVSNYMIETNKARENIKLLFGTTISYKITKKVQKMTIKEGTSGNSIFIQTKKKEPTIIYLPKKMDQSLHISLGHEYIHLLKDNYPQEEKDYFRFSEVLPIFYEWIHMGSNTPNKNEWIVKAKMNNMAIVNNNLQKADEYLPTEIVPCFMMHNQIYQIAFYYSLILYSFYQQHPKEVLKEIKKVLKGQITTQQLLEQFHIYNELEHPLFQKEYQKILKKIN